MKVIDGNSLIYDRSTKVLKRGHVSEETNGILISNTASIAIRSESNNGYVYQFDNCYEIRSIEQSKPVFEAGDSGSAVFVHEWDELKPLGIAFAFDAGETTYACRIDQIVQAFNLSIYQEEEDMDTQDD